MKFIQILCAVIFPFILSTGLNASDGRGLEIAAEADNRDIGFGDTISTMTMTLYDQYGKYDIAEDQKQNIGGNRPGRPFSGYF